LDLRSLDQNVLKAGYMSIEINNGHYRRALDRLLEAASIEAVSLRQNWIGPEHFILAILATQPTCPSALALNRLGITHTLVSAALIEGDTSSTSELGSVDLEVSPAAYELVGRAEGVAAGLAASSVAAEHVLIAYVWDPDTAIEIGSWNGATRDAIIAMLRELDVIVPRGPLPDELRRQSGSRVPVPIDKLMLVVEELSNRLSPDSGLGFNEDDEGNAWVIANREIDLERLVRGVLEGHNIES
jgi:hypothetical protein